MEKDKNAENFNNFSINPPEEMKTERAPSRILSRILILGAVLVVLVVLSIAVVNLLPRALSSLASVNFSFSSLFSPKEKITITADKSRINSGESFIVNFKHTGGTQAGYFNLSTSCQNVFQLKYQAGNNSRSVDCKNTVRLDASSTSFTLIGINAGGSSVTAPVSIDFVSSDDGKIQASGETTVVINPAISLPLNDNGSDNNNKGGGTTATSSHPNPPSPEPATGGLPDLVVRITAVGVRDRNTGAFIATGNVNTNDRVTFQFQVQNIGNAPSGSWSLRAILPAVNPADQTKYLYNQASIPPGLAVSGELYFDYVQTGQNRLVQINIDPSGQLQELRKDNNMAETTINATGSGSGVTSNGIDLSVKILDTGIIDRSSGQYFATSRIGSGDRAGLRFQVTNNGSRASGSWVFRISLPDSNDNFDTDSTQPSLAGGETRIYTVGLDGLNRNDNNSVEINVDPNDRIDETRENNNSDSTDINVN